MRARAITCHEVDGVRALILFGAMVEVAVVLAGPRRKIRTDSCGPGEFIPKLLQTVADNGSSFSHKVVIC